MFGGPQVLQILRRHRQQPVIPAAHIQPVVQMEQVVLLIGYIQHIRYTRFGMHDARVVVQPLGG